MFGSAKAAACKSAILMVADVKLSSLLGKPILSYNASCIARAMALANASATSQPEESRHSCTVELPRI